MHLFCSNFILLELGRDCQDCALPARPNPWAARQEPRGRIGDDRSAAVNVVMTMAYARIPEHVASAAPVQLEAVSVAYNGKLALKEISFSLAAGDSVAGVGPNRGRQTTLFRTTA